MHSRPVTNAKHKKIQQPSKKPITATEDITVTTTSNNTNNYCCLSQSNSCHCYLFTLFRLNFTHSSSRKRKSNTHNCIMCGRPCCRRRSRTSRRRSTPESPHTNQSYASSLKVYEKSNELGALKTLYALLLKACCCFACFLFPTQRQGRQNDGQNALDDIERTSIYFKEEGDEENQKHTKEEKAGERGVEGEGAETLRNVQVCTSTVDDCFYVKRKTKRSQGRERWWCCLTEATSRLLRQSDRRDEMALDLNRKKGAHKSSSLCSSKKSSIGRFFKKDTKINPRNIKIAPRKKLRLKTF